MSDKPTVGLTMPKNPALALQEIHRQQMATSPGIAPTPDAEAEDVSNHLTSKMVSQLDRQIDSESDSSLVSEAVSSSDSQKDSKAAAPTRRKRGEPGTASSPDTIGKALQTAQHLGETPMKAVGIKLPEGLNEYLDDLVYRLKKQGKPKQKQELIKRALQLLVIEQETGNAFADFD